MGDSGGTLWSMRAKSRQPWWSYLPDRELLQMRLKDLHVSSQIFGVRGNEIVLFDQPRPIRSMADLTGWNPQKILDTCLPAMAPDFFKLDASADVFPYDPV